MMRKGLVAVLILGLLTACGSPWANRLPYAGPVEQTVARGEFLPGTPIQYLEKTSKGALLSIESKEKIKEIGDAVDWREDVAHGINVDQTYRIAQIDEDAVQLKGTVRVIIQNAIPRPGPANREAALHFQFPVGYHVQPGQVIPGTTLTFVGVSEQGAELGNISGDPYRQVNDPILWEGQLGYNIWIALDLRPTLISAETLDIVGTAEIWIQP